MSDELREKCGIFGIYSKSIEVAHTAFYGLFALQHRGQEGSGICVSDGATLHIHKGTGLVSQIYNEKDMKDLFGYIAIGHNRYSTFRGGQTDLEDVQPFISKTGRTSLAHNGNLPSVLALKEFLSAKNISTENANDSKLMHLAIESYLDEGLTLPEAVEKAFPLFTGAFSLLVMDKDTLVAVRDKYGMRPFSVGTIGSHTFIFASETCALETVGAEVYFDVGPGEMMIVKDGKMESKKLAPPSPKFDIFELVYFARPDSMLLGKSVYRVRSNFGSELAKEVKIEADIVIPVPETAIPSAINFSRDSGIPIEMALTKNRYIHRTFIEPDQHTRALGVKLKLTPLREIITGKRIIIMDDSIVRGTTSRGIVKLLFDAGAKEVHFLVASPPVRFPDFYGIDTPKQEDLIAAKMSVPEIAKFLGATSLHFLSVEGMVRATGVDPELLSLSAFTGEYPISLLERAGEVNHNVPKD
jgi:amidophosphoribosyltransferase